MTVIIAAVPRSGSSLLCKIFVAHGLWVGRHGLKNMNNTPVRYPSYENADIDDWFKKPRGSFFARVKHVVPAGERLVYKCSPVKAITAHKMLRGSVIVRCHRKFSSIMQSSTELRRQQRTSQRRVIEQIECPVIDMDAVMRRDFATLEAAMDHCGIDHQPELTEAQIDDGLWHYR